jgi:hypothetical protein
VSTPVLAGVTVREWLDLEAQAADNERRRDDLREALSEAEAEYAERQTEELRWFLMGMRFAASLVGVTA